MRQNNGEILSELVNRLSTWNYYSKIADVFLHRVLTPMFLLQLTNTTQQMDLLQAHLPYIVNYERAQEVVKACQKIPEFVAFVNVCQHTQATLSHWCLGKNENGGVGVQGT